MAIEQVDLSDENGKYTITIKEDGKIHINEDVETHMESYELVMNVFRALIRAHIELRKRMN